MILKDIILQTTFINATTIASYHLIYHLFWYRKDNRVAQLHFSFHSEMTQRAWPLLNQFKQYTPSQLLLHTYTPVCKLQRLTASSQKYYIFGRHVQSNAFHYPAPQSFQISLGRRVARTELSIADLDQTFCVTSKTIWRPIIHDSYIFENENNKSQQKCCSGTIQVDPARDPLSKLDIPGMFLYAVYESLRAFCLWQMQ